MIAVCQNDYTQNISTLDQDHSILHTLHLFVYCFQLTFYYSSLTFHGQMSPQQRVQKEVP